MITQDALRQVADSVLSAQVYQWQDVSDPWAVLRRLWLQLLAWLEVLRQQNPGAYRVLFWSLVVVLVAIVSHAAWVAARTMYSGGAQELGGAPTRRVEGRDARWYRMEAERLAAGGRFANAMQHDFVRLMLEFDSAKLIAFHPSKTPIEYVQDARINPAQRRNLGALVRTMYQHAYARAPSDSNTWVTWRHNAVIERYARPN